MRAYLEIELLGEDGREYLRFCRDIGEMVRPGLGHDTFGRLPPRSGWVAEITGYDQKYKYARKFLKPKIDYSRANSKGSRGVYAEYILESGRIYDVLQPVSWKNSLRYFCTVDDEGNIVQIEEERVREILGEPPPPKEKEPIQTEFAGTYYPALGILIEGKEPTIEQKAYVIGAMKVKLSIIINCLRLLKDRMDPEELNRMLKTRRFLYSSYNNQHYGLWDEMINATLMYDYCAGIIGVEKLDLEKLAREVEVQNG